MARMAARAVGMLILVKIFPFYFRWRMRRKAGSERKGVLKIEYWGLQGTAPGIPFRAHGRTTNRA